MAGHARQIRQAGGFFAARWRGAVALDRLFWIDMVLVATLLNIAAAFASVLLFGFKLPAWLAVAVYLSPLPYNVFLALAVWRTAERAAPPSATGYRLGALVWLAASLLV